MKTNNILLQLSKPIKITKRPFREFSRKLGIEEKQATAILSSYRKKGVIRRFGAVLNHRKAGFKVNALVCWKTPKDKIAVIKKNIGNFSNVSHCYLRKPYTQWPYNFYCMLHSHNKKECLAEIKRISSLLKTNDYKVLFTLKEFKKTRSTILYGKK